jgi:chromosomal replication initiator protein
MGTNEVWQAVLGELQLQMTRGTFNTWLKPTRILSREDGVFTVGVENDYVKDWLSNRLLATVQRTVASIVGKETGEVEVRFVVWSRKQAVG